MARLSLVGQVGGATGQRLTEEEGLSSQSGVTVLNICHCSSSVLEQAQLARLNEKPPFIFIFYFKKN